MRRQESALIFIIALLAGAVLFVPLALSGPSSVEQHIPSHSISIKLTPMKIVSLKELARERARLKGWLDKKKYAYLTFDDGPNETITPRILDILKEKDVKATFFVVGSLAAAHPQMLRRISSDGHTVGNHCWTHDYHSLYRSTKSFLDSASRVSAYIRQVTGKPAPVLRPPGGAFGWIDRPAVIRAVNVRGFRVYNWHVDSGDGGGWPAANRQVYNVISQAKHLQRRRIIILMHDTKRNLIVALPPMIDQLRALGYEFKPLTTDVPQRY